MPGENVGKIYYREGINGSEQLLFDPTAYMKGKTLSVRSFIPSYDGKKLAIEYTEKGAEMSVLKIMDVDSKLFLRDSLYPAFNFSWTFDNKSILYICLKSADSKDPTAYLNSKTKLHVLGTDTKSDIDFFSNESYPELNIDPGIFPGAFLDEGSMNYIFSELGSSQNEHTQYYAPIEQLNSQKITWKPLCKASDSLIDLIYLNDDVYAISHFNAPNYKIVETSLKHPEWANALIIVPEKPRWTIISFIHSKDYLLIEYSDGINDHLSKYSFNTKTTSDVKLPESGSIYINCLNTKTNNFILQIRSWNEPRTQYNYDAATDALVPFNFYKPLVYPTAYNNLEVEEVEVKGHDGVIIPLTIIYKKGIKKNGSNICLMEGYGAYGNSEVPIFDNLRNSLAVHDVVIAIAHVRGGGEKGEAWHMGGFKTTKPNTWKDFISCVEYLIAKGYTSPKKLACNGASAGGILISRSITERPDLFAARKSSSMGAG